MPQTCSYVVGTPGGVADGGAAPGESTQLAPADTRKHLRPVMITGIVRRACVAIPDARPALPRAIPEGAIGGNDGGVTTWCVPSGGRSW